ncbi:MAG: hypothetical protein HY744_11140 [Deltaproteobacteria bacterium]|nr:hypothetical protein [Deltaproteobacteria bacterium]
MDAAGASEPTGGPDPELSGLPPSPQPLRKLSLVLMALVLVAASASAWLLRGEAIYALVEHRPRELGDLGSVPLRAEHAGRFVRARATLDLSRSVRYRRLAERDGFRLAPVAGAPARWVQFRVPAGYSGAAFVAPDVLAGRLVRLGDFGGRHLGLGRALVRAGAPAAGEIWVLLDGDDPPSCEWVLALAALMLALAAWSLWGIVRVVRRVRPI